MPHARTNLCTDLDTMMTISRPFRVGKPPALPSRLPVRGGTCKWNVKCLTWKNCSRIRTLGGSQLLAPVYTQRQMQRRVPTWVRVAVGRRGAQLLHALACRIAIPSGSCDFNTQLIDLAQGRLAPKFAYRVLRPIRYFRFELNLWV